MNRTFALLLFASLTAFDGARAAGVIVVNGGAVPAQGGANNERNETMAINGCRAVAEAEEIYHRTDYDGNGVLEFAQVLGGRTEDFKHYSTEPIAVTPPSDAEKTQIENLIKTLNDDDFAAREKASAALLAFGTKALRLAEAAAKDSLEPEVALRCQRIAEGIADANSSAPRLKLKFQFGLIGSNGQEELSLIDRATAAAECPAGCDPTKSAPRAGYLYRILTRQSEAATGGKLDYIADGAMTRGYGVLAFPANYGAGGKRCFIINNNGTIYGRDFGSKKETEDYVKDCTEFNPTTEWKPAN